MAQVSTLPVTPNTKHIQWNKRWMVYDKDDVLDKLTENLDTLIKYFTACEDKKKDIICNEKMENYIQSRLQNVHNLISSLTLHDEIPQDQYSYFDSVHVQLEKEFGKSKESFDLLDLSVRTTLLRDYIDSIIDMSIFDEEEEIDSEVEQELEDELLKNEKIILPDNASIIDVNNECKKRKL